MIKVRALNLNAKSLKEEFKKINVDSRGVDIMLPKGEFQFLKIEKISCVLANVIKQQMLSSGGEAAVARGVVDSRVKYSDCIIMGTRQQYSNLINKLKKQPWGLDEIAAEIKNVLADYTKEKKEISFSKYRLKCGSRALVMGIVNVTPDSFSDGGKFYKLDSAVKEAIRLVSDGADIIDIGGESTRPGAGNVSIAEEIKRVVPVVKEIRKKIKVPISIDTRKSKVAEAAIKAGANIINDVSGLHFDKDMARIAKKYNVPVIIMHMKGSPKTMQEKPAYNDVVSDIFDYFRKSISYALKSGIDKKKIILDPGIGFGKRQQDNIEILKRLKEFKSLGCPLLVGTSRKSFIGEILKLPVEKRINGTIASCIYAIINGCDIVRVHDVKEVKEALKVIDKLR